MTANLMGEKVEIAGETKEEEEGEEHIFIMM